VAFSQADLAAAYALNVLPRMQINPSTRLGLYYERPFREYRIFQVRQKPPDPQLSLFREAE
jgi:hypothetical protein